MVMVNLQNLIFENRADAEAYAKENRTMDTHLYAEELIDYRLPFGEGGKVYRMMKRGGEVIVKDIFVYQSPLGFLGKFADFLFLKKYMTNFLIERNKVIKEYAESDKWKQILLR